MRVSFQVAAVEALTCALRAHAVRSWCAIR